MSDATTSRRLAAELPVGQHELFNAQLRDLYGLRRVTPAARGRIAAELERAGLEVLSDPAREPLVVRKTAHAPAGAPDKREADQKLVREAAAHGCALLGVSFASS
jgi:hypothetical protein